MIFRPRRIRGTWLRFASNWQPSVVTLSRTKSGRGLLRGRTIFMKKSCSATGCSSTNSMCQVRRLVLLLMPQVNSLRTLELISSLLHVKLSVCSSKLFWETQTSAAEIEYTQCANYTHLGLRLQFRIREHIEENYHPKFSCLWFHLQPTRVPNKTTQIMQFN